MSKRDSTTFHSFVKLMENSGLKYCDIKTDLDGDMEAITFANNELYISKVQEIVTTQEDII